MRLRRLLPPAALVPAPGPPEMAAVLEALAGSPAEGVPGVSAVPAAVFPAAVAPVASPVAAALAEAAQAEDKRLRAQ